MRSAGRGGDLRRATAASFREWDGHFQPVFEEIRGARRTGRLLYVLRDEDLQQNALSGLHALDSPIYGNCKRTPPHRRGAWLGLFLECEPGHPTARLATPAPRQGFRM